MAYDQADRIAVGRRRHAAAGLVLCLAAGLVLRLWLWDRLPRTGLVSDEGEYLAAAVWLAEGRGFSWYQGYLWTRAPLYPLFVAAHLRLFGTALAPIFITQTLLSLLNIVLTWALARALGAGARVAGLAALLAAVALPLAAYAQILLSETLFISLLLGALLLLAHAGRGGWPWLAAAGLALGLAALTRSLALALIPLAALWAAVSAGPRLAARLRAAALVGGVALALVAPWALYATRQYGGPIVVDTTGTYNLLLGAQQALPPSERPRQGALVRELLAQGVPHGAQQATLRDEALRLIAAHPVAYAAKSARELIDLLRINYSGDERFADGFTAGRLPAWYALALLLLEDALSLALLALGALGMVAGARPGPTPRLHPLLVGWLLFSLAAAPLLFAINRFRVPLLPILCIYAALGVAALLRGARGPRLALGAMLGAALLYLAAAPAAWLGPLALPGRESFLGPHPSSLNSTRLALQARAGYLAGEQLRVALAAGDAAAAAAALGDPALPERTRLQGQVLLAARRGDLAAALSALDALDALAASTGDGTARQAAIIIRADLLRSQGDAPAARALLDTRALRAADPQRWAWDWLRPAPARTIDLGAGLDLGYIQGFYRPERDPGGSVRWSQPQASLRFPGAGSGAPQMLTLVAHAPARAPASVQVYANGAPAGTLTIGPDLGTHTLALPAMPTGADVIVDLRVTPAVPEPAAYLDAGLLLIGIRVDTVALAP